ncbi:methyltransferase [Fusarium redolens polymycovirus 1]|uniref:Methyltransferase n=1 Tax=Fusarium redolens polymycovirus 1 TaxID=2546034 RepID=A0A513ZVD8_9VIRU|nr:methyltransferase [Fusarium redolens polymycovirus 1]QDH44658.1 methyltransferase [Fusarium redolens polymycovirus 1]
MRQYAHRSVRGARPPSSSVASWRSTARERPPSIRSGSSFSIALSGARSVSTVKANTESVEHHAPLEIYEYGDPLAEYLSTPVVDHSDETSTTALRYLTAAQLESLRNTERSASITLLSVIKSLVPVNGSHVLILACGSGSFSRGVAKLGPASLTLVDLDRTAVHRAVKSIEACGQDAAVSVYPEVSGAWEFVGDSDLKYDLVVCTHSVGQIVKSSPDSLQLFVDDVASVLAPGGVLVMDEHLGFTDVDGPAPGDLQDTVDRFIATGLGKFHDDVNYTLPRAVKGCTRRAEWTTPGKPHPMQRWQYFAYERRDDDNDSDESHVVAPCDFSRLGPLPVCGSVSDRSIFDMCYPSAARGRKVPLARDDQQSTHPTKMMPKLDGSPVVVSFEDDVCTFFGSTEGGTFRLPMAFDQPVMAIGELCTTSIGNKLIFITGVVDIGGACVDPMSETIMSGFRQLIAPLMTVGIVPNMPSLLPHVTHDRLNLPRAPNGQSVPVDGINVRMGDRWGKFFKASSTLSVDVTSVSWQEFRKQAEGTLTLLRPFGTTELPAVSVPDGVADSDVIEVGVRVAQKRPQPVLLRRRRDKTASDGLGKFVVFLSGVQRMGALGSVVKNTQELVAYLNTG